jgi:SAM-dependent methyltransferase
VSRTFDVVTMFNVFYALPDPVRALSALARVAAENARLLIFDYVDRGRYQDDPILDSGGPFLPNPPKLPDLSDTFLASGWRIEEVRSIDEDYKRRYGALVDKITAKRAAIEALGGAEGYAHVHDLYSRPLADLRSGRLGGAIIEGQRAG